MHMHSGKMQFYLKGGYKITAEKRKTEGQLTPNVLFETPIYSLIKVIITFNIDVKKNVAPKKCK